MNQSIIMLVPEQVDTMTNRKSSERSGIECGKVTDDIRLKRNMSKNKTTNRKDDGRGI